jgi:hypothetical protein
MVKNPHPSPRDQLWSVMGSLPSPQTQEPDHKRPGSISYPATPLSRAYTRRSVTLSLSPKGQTGLAEAPCPPEGDARHRAMPHPCLGRARLLLRGMRGDAIHLSLLPQPPLSQVSKREGPGVVGAAAGAAPARALLPAHLHLAHLAPYIFRVAVSNKRILKVADGADEYIRR